MVCSENHNYYRQASFSKSQFAMLYVCQRGVERHPRITKPRAALRVDPTTPKSINPSLVRSTRPKLRNSDTGFRDRRFQPLRCPTTPHVIGSR